MKKGKCRDIISLCSDASHITFTEIPRELDNVSLSLNVYMSVGVCTYKSTFMFVLRIYNTHPQSHTHSRIIPNHPLFQMNLINFHAITLRFGVCGDKSGHGIYKNSLTELHTREKRNKKLPTLHLPASRCVVRLCLKTH